MTAKTYRSENKREIRPGNGVARVKVLRGFLQSRSQSVNGFGRKWRFVVWVEGKATTVEIQVGKDRYSGMILTLGILRCAQNDGKDLS
jgi:hypothetical protein